MRRLRTKVPEQLILACLGALALLIAGFLILTPSLLATAPEVLKYSLHNLQEQESYYLAIEEYSTGYQLKFKGEIINCTDIKGKILDHGLEVHRKDSKLYLKLEDDLEWKLAEQLQLNSLNSFITHPAEVLKAQQDNFTRFNVQTKNSDRYNISFNTSSPDKKFLKLFFPKISPAAIHSINIEVVIADANPELRLKQLGICLQFKDSAYGNLKRFYHLY
ncbi:MAG TPA: hypothetical protein GX693_05290 [Firmicutes bacterium]|nr:hypothetical protein [Bacillota bacterium]